MQPPYVIRIISLHMQESGTYNVMHERPMQTDVRDMQYIYDLNRRLDQDQVKRITPSVVAGIASKIVSPSHTPGAPIGILNGWDTRRIRFILHVGIEYTGGSGLSDHEYYFQGFTDHGDVGYGGAIDPRMLLVINSFVRVGKENTYGPNGAYIKRVITDAGQVINGNIVYQGTGHDSYGLRPKDAFMGMQSFEIFNAQSDQIPGFDGRYKFGNKAGIASKYDVTPAAYLASVTDSYFDAFNTRTIDPRAADVYERAKAATGRDGLLDNCFFKRVRAVVNEPNYTGTHFCMSVLEAIDPNVANVTTLARMGQATQSQYHHQGQSEFWTSALPEAHWATVLGNAVPALMMEMMLSNMTFMVTNKLLGGIPSITIVDAVSITGADITVHMEHFKTRLINEVLNDISYNNMMIYDITLKADTFGETHISIALESNPFTSYCIPTFVDSMVSPLMTANKDVFYNTVNDLSYIIQQVGESITPDYGSANTLFSNRTFL